jgi:hypothetical protein
LGTREKDEKQHAEQTTTLRDRLTAIEQQSGELKHELADNAKRLGDLEATYWGQRESDRRQHNEQTKMLADRLTAADQQSGELKLGMADGGKRLDDLEATYWGQRDSDERQRNEQTKDLTEKVTMCEGQVADVAEELKEVKRDLARATDTTYQIHQMEMRLDERRIAADENKRGPQGPPGPKGPKGDPGPAGKASQRFATRREHRPQLIVTNRRPGC